MRHYRTEEEKDKIEEQSHPDHEPIVPLNYKLEQEKEEKRKLEEELRKKAGKYVPVVMTESGKLKSINDLTVPEQEMEFVKCATDPIYFIETYLTIFDQTQGVAGKIVPFKLFNYQKKVINSYLTNRFVVVNKYRQGGISHVSCSFSAWYIMFQKNRSVAIIANKLDTAKDELMKKVVDFIEGCPDWLRPKTGKETNNKFKDTQKLKRYDNGSTIGAFSSKGLRGYAPTLIFWDEVAWTEKNDLFWLSTYPSLQTGGKAIMVSCVTKDTYLFTDNGIKQIGDYIPNEELGAHIINEYSVLGKDKLRTGNLFFNNGYVDTLKINTTFSWLESSYNHKYWAYKINDDKYDWYKASELEVGDYVSIQYGMNIWGNNNDCSDFKPSDSNKIVNIFSPKEITTDIAYLLGLFISEGYARKIYKNNKFVSAQLTLTCGDSLEHIFNKIGFSCYFDGIHYTINSKNIGEFLEYLGFDLSKKAKEKIIPSRLLQMSRENIIALIQGIMDGDGYATYGVKRNRIRVGIGLSSKELINQIRIILSSFGILTEYHESITPPTKKVKVSSNRYSITANSEYAIKYFNEIGFRFKRKQDVLKLYKPNEIKHTGVYDNIPNGSEIIYDVYQKTKKYGKLIELSKNKLNIKTIVDHYNNEKPTPINRKTILKYIKYEKELLGYDYINSLSHIVNENLLWTPIKSIEKSKNWTYDFSLPNFPEEEHEFNHSVIYNQMVTHNTPSGLDPVFFKTFDGARKGQNNFKAVELWWYNDPRYNKDLVWLKNKGKTNEIRLVDENWSDEYRIQLADDGWTASSPWFEAQVRDANGDMRRIAQELLCSFLGSGDNFIAEEFLKRIDENEIRVPIRQEFTDLNMWIYEDPIPGEQYVMGVDVASGYGDDNCTINILKFVEIIEEKTVNKNGKLKKERTRHSKIEQVAEYHGKTSPQILAEICTIYGKQYNNAYTVVDITGGYGAQVVDKLFEYGYSAEDIHYSEISHKTSRDRLQGYIKKAQKNMMDGTIITVDLVPGFFIGNNRASVLLELQRSIHMGDVVIRSVRLLNELKTFITVAGNRVADHKRSFHDDSIMGFAIGLFTINYEMKKFNIKKEVSEKIINAMINANTQDNQNIMKKQNQYRNQMNNNPYAIHGWLFK
jgi:hypothetical protein